jgi:hypothetical protein
MNGPALPVRETRAPDTEYRVVELSVVTDEEMTRVVNVTQSDGWRFESVHFAMWPGSKRPSMAFLFFIRAAAGGESGS